MEKTNVIPYIAKALVAATLSPGARNLLAQIIIWSGEKGYCWWSAPRIAKESGESVCTIRRRIATLVDAGYLQVTHRIGQSNFLTPVMDDEPPCANSRTIKVKENQKEKENVENANAHAHKVSEIEEVTSDKHSTGAFFNAVKSNTPEIIDEALRATKRAAATGAAHNPGAYFLAIVKQLANFEPPPHRDWIDELQPSYVDLDLRKLYPRWEKASNMTGETEFKGWLKQIRGTQQRRLYDEHPELRLSSRCYG